METEVKKKIEAKDIRKGDLIRLDGLTQHGVLEVVEYRAKRDRHLWAECHSATIHLLDRPAKELEPYWGMVIGDEHEPVDRAVFIPSDADDKTPWLKNMIHQEDQYSWEDDAWASKMVNEKGWVIIDKPDWLD